MKKIFIILVTIICFTNNLYAHKDRWDTDKSNWSELMLAIYHRNNNKVKQLINSDVDILYSVGGYFDLTAMGVAIYRENKMAVYELLQTGKVVDITKYLYQACMGTNIDIVKLLCEFGADVNFIDKNGYNSIMYAASFSTIEVMNYLIGQNVNVNLGRRPGDGATALILAAYNLDIDKIKILLQAGSNKYAEQISGRTAYDIVQDNNYAKITENKRKEILGLLK